MSVVDVTTVSLSASDHTGGWFGFYFYFTGSIGQA